MKNSTANILEKETVILETKGIHGENCSVKNIDWQILAMTCNRKAVEDVCQRPRKIILGEINAFGVSSKRQQMMSLQYENVYTVLVVKFYRWSQHV
ncbi:unnamed protein product [Macrosiphum euphorbiae]|uniref:Uncharacterized protein n=1 Tax=Macrosiphum euphorbiae TaxID=13131 RepID=A0AAV0WN05_9HEMI|nr:unnamed protein product [Macrosiphum euphorbiae]